MKGVRLAMVLQFAVAGVAIAENEMSRDMDHKSVDRSVVSTKIDKQAPMGTIRASKLIGTEVYNRDGKHLGEIHDVVLDSDQRKIGYIVLSYGGLAGLGDKLFAMPHNLVRFAPDDKKAHVALDEQVLRNAPGFDQSKWPTEANSAEYFRSLDTYYRQHATLDKPAVSDQDKALPAAGRMETDPSFREHDKGRTITWSRRASSLIGANVENAAGDNLGEVKDLVLDLGSGNVRYAVLSYGGMLGIGDKLFAVPIDSFTTRADDNKLVLNINKDQLKNAPGFSKDNWPDMADQQWHRSVDEFYRTTRTDTSMPR